MNMARREFIIINALLMMTAVLAQKQFTIVASRFDELSKHPKKCDIGINFEIVIQCNDGYTAIDQLSSFLESDQTVDADISFNYSRPVTKIRVGDYISMINNDYQRYQVYQYQEDTKKYNLYEFNLKSTNVIVDGYFSNKFLVIQFLENTTTALQVHEVESTNSFKVVTAISGNIISFDCITLNKIFFIYAVQQSPNNTKKYSLVQKQVSTESLLDYQSSSYIDNCGTQIKVTPQVIIVSCPSYNNNTGKVSLYQRNTLDLIKEYAGDYKGAYFGDELDILQYQDGKQIYAIFTSNSSTGVQNQVQSIEVIMNSDTVASEQFIQKSTITVPSSDSTNYGQLNIGAGDHYLLMIYENFDRIYGYTYCSYNQRLDANDQTKCIDCPSDQVSLTSSAQQCISCSSDISGTENDNKKFKFICSMTESSPNVTLIITLSILCVGGACLSIVLIVVCRRKRLLCFKRIDMSNREIQDEERQQREREKQERRMRIIELKLKTTKFCNIKGENKQANCSICFEEFTDDSQVRQTPCKHLFHNPCLIEWVKTKIDKPDCPYCRAELNI